MNEPGNKYHVFGTSQILFPILSDIPQELKEIDRWGLTRLEITDNPDRPTKPFYIAEQCGHKGAIDNKASFRSFKEASRAPFVCSTPVSPSADVKDTGYSALGFVLSADDEIVAIDLDNKSRCPQVELEHQSTIALLDSYTERSPSGTGYRIFLKTKSKATLPAGRRRGDVEAYCSGRYVTVTGHIVNNTTIEYREELLAKLFFELGSERSGQAGLQADREATLDDATVVALLSRDPALAALCSGYTSAYAGDTNRADLALCNALAARSGNRAQVERIWMDTRLGQREKTQKRADYRKVTIEAAFDRPELAPVNFSGITANGKPVPIGVAPTFPDQCQQDANPRVWDAGQWEGVEPQPQREIVPGLILAGHVNSLYSPGGNYKTLLTQHLLTSVALAEPFQGKQVMSGNALMLNCEDDLNSRHKIQRLINSHHQRAINELAGKLFFACRAGCFGNELATFDRNGIMRLTEAYDDLKQLIIDNEILVAGLDNVAHLFGGNENDRNQVTSFLVSLERLAMETGAGIILIGHYNKGGQVSGSTAWLNQVRNVIVIEKAPEHPTKRIIKVEKSNYLRTGVWGEFEWRDGIAVPIERGNNGEGLADLLAEQSFLTCLEFATKQMRTTSHITGANYAPTLFARMPEAKGTSKAAFVGALDRLISKGIVEVDKKLWQRENRNWKYGLKLHRPPAPTPCTDPHQPP